MSNQDALDRLADILWFVKGAMLREGFFSYAHVEALQLARNALYQKEPVDGKNLPI